MIFQTFLAEINPHSMADQSSRGGDQIILVCLSNSVPSFTHIEMFLIFNKLTRFFYDIYRLLVII